MNPDLELPYVQDATREADIERLEASERSNIWCDMKEADKAYLFVDENIADTTMVLSKIYQAMAIAMDERGIEAKIKFYADIAAILDAPINAVAESKAEQRYMDEE